MAKKEQDTDALISPRVWPHDFQSVGPWPSSELFQDIQLDVQNIRFDHPYAAKEDLSSALRLPELDKFEFGELESIGIPEVTELISQTDEGASPNATEEEDIWESVSVLSPLQKLPGYRTWESFEAHNLNLVVGSAYLSEAGLDAISSVFRATEVAEPEQKRQTLNTSIFLRSLVALGLGRESILFEWDKRRRVFRKRIKNGCLKGVSGECSQSLVAGFLENGRIFRSLEEFAETAYLSKHVFPAKAALANSVSTVLSTLEGELGSKSATSMLQLKALFREPHRIIRHLKDLIDHVRSAESNEGLTTLMFSFLQSREHLEPKLRNIDLQILSQVSSPWIELIEEWTGLREEGSASFKESRGFILNSGENSKEDQEKEGDHYLYNESLMPPFIPEEDGRIIFETGVSLRFIRSHHANDPLSQPRKFGLQAPKIKWLFDWDSVERVTAKANIYEQALISAVNGLKSNPNFDLVRSQRPLNKDAGTMETPNTSLFNDPQRYVDDSRKILDETPIDDADEFADSIKSLVMLALKDDNFGNSDDLAIFTPPLSVTPFLSFNPLLATQARLVNGIALRKIFRSHHLRLHFDLLRDYQLLGDGVFVSSLSSALFSAQLESTERRSGVFRSGHMMGLKLGTRSTWPPASSELRLALMGILTRCYQSSRLHARFNRNGQPVLSSGYREQEEVPGQMSFGIRSLSEDEIEKLMNPQAIYALDFLRIQYNPSAPLDLVFTNTVLDKYDRIFKFLLRLLRLLYIVAHLPRHRLSVVETKFRLEANFFINALSNYFFETGIGDAWDGFTAFLNTLERQLNTEDKRGEMGTLVSQGIESVKSRHDDCLDQILFSLFLRKRHERVMDLLEGIFNLVLQFAGKLQDGHSRSQKTVESLHKEFLVKVKVFRDVCKGLSTKESRDKLKTTWREDTIMRLLRNFDNWSL